MDFLKPKSSYRTLICYQKAECIYDITYWFVQHYLKIGDRTCDQMIQAARSGKQNIVEGRSAAATSRETEIKLYNVARASLQELLVDYEDYLRTRGLQLWVPGNVRLEKLKAYCVAHSSTNDYMAIVGKCNATEIANLAITLIHQDDTMLRKLIDYAKDDFIKNGGAREEMTRARLQYRQQNGYNSLNDGNGMINSINNRR